LVNHQIQQGVHIAMIVKKRMKSGFSRKVVGQ